MTCSACGEKPVESSKDFTKAVIEINNPESLVLLRKVVIPASMGTEEDVPPAIGKYRNVLLQYAANDHIYLYSSDGIPTAITANIPQEILDSIAELEATDVVLQQEIDDLKNSPDVVDIVPTYAALQAYDTSKLGDNDIIRVLQDEQHDGQSTYYRWDATTSSWTYIGAVGDYYTKGQVDTLLASKQNTLTAGANVQISPENVISATDTTYTHFTGATASTDGTAGLVPAPVAGDDTKFLSGDGTWGTPAGTTYTAGTNVQISAQNVISATDTTYSNFVGTDGQTAGTAGLVPAPATADAGKFLKADGTWDTAGGGGGGDSVYSTVTTSNSSTGGAVYIGNLDASQDEVTDPTTTDNHYKYFWALPVDNTQVPGSQTINICGDIYGGHGNNSNTVIGTGTIGEDGTAWNSTANVMIAPFTQMSTRAQIGNSARTIEAVTIGQGARVNGGAGCVAIGKSASVTNGDSTLNSALASMAFGTSANCSTTNSIAMGAYSQPTRSGELNIGGSSNGGGWGYNNTDYRLLGGVHDGLLDHDAATVGQLNGRVKQNAGAPTTATVGTIGQLLEDTTNGKLYICTAIDTTDPQNPSYTWTEVGAGGGGGGDTVYSTVTTSNARDGGAVYIGDKNSSQVIAGDPTATDNHYRYFWALPYSAAIDATTVIPGDETVNIGGVQGSIAGGMNGGTHNVNIGYRSRTGSWEDGQTVVGWQAQTGDSYCTAYGANSNANARWSVAIGYDAQCYQQGSVALGKGAYPTRAGEVFIGSDSTASGFNSTVYRVIGGVHDGQADHDAVTLGQLNGRVITNAGAPTTSTAGTVGQLLEDTTNGKLYICTAVDTTDPNTPVYTWTEVGAGGGGTTEIEYVNCTLTGTTATGFTLSADKTATQAKALVESGKEVIYKFVNSTTVGSMLAGTYEFSVLFAGTNTSVDVVTGYGITVPYGATAPDIYTFTHMSSNVTVTANTVPTVNDATLTIQKNGTTVQTFTANASSNATANIEVPTITMTTTDPGEGSALAADNYVAVYGGDPVILDYSTSEINTGATWIDGSVIYKKTVNFGALPNATSKDVAHGISNLGRVVKIEGYAYRSSDSTNFPIPFASEVTGASIGVSVTSTNISIGAGVDRSNITECYVTLYYTKSA